MKSSDDRALKRLGILQTDAVLPQFIDEHGDYPEMFRRLLSQACAEVIVFDVREAVPAADAADAYLITGSRHSVYEDLPWIPPLVKFLEEEMASHHPVVGICFGHQLLAHHFGGEVRPADAGWAVGMHRAEVTSPQHWMGAGERTFGILSSHKDQVVSVPPGATVFASTPFCPISGFVIDDLVLTFQGHPEFRKPYSKALMEHRRDLLGEHTYEQGIASLAEPLDDERVARWILRFLAMEPPLE